MESPRDLHEVLMLVAVQLQIIADDFKRHLDYKIGRWYNVSELYYLGYEISDNFTIEHMVKTLTPGDIIQIERSLGYSHYALYTGINNEGEPVVIHFTSPPHFNIFSFKQDAIVIEQELRKVVGKNRTRLNNFCDRSDRPLTKKEMEERVNYYVANPEKFGKYHVYHNNCEHFATHVRYGKKMSLQSMTAPMSAAELMAYHTSFNQEFMNTVIVILLGIAFSVVFSLRYWNVLDYPALTPLSHKIFLHKDLYFMLMCIIACYVHNRSRLLDHVHPLSVYNLLFFILDHASFLIICLTVEACVVSYKCHIVTLFHPQSLLGQMKIVIIGFIVLHIAVTTYRKNRLIQVLQMCQLYKKVDEWVVAKQQSANNHSFRH